jgi:hypothetical protein
MRWISTGLGSGSGASLGGAAGAPDLDEDRMAGAAELGAEGAACPAALVPGVDGAGELAGGDGTSVTGAFGRVGPGVVADGGGEVGDGGADAG